MKQKIHNELNEALKYNLSFAGCGFLGIYHVGVAVCFKKYAPQLLLQKISGASAGALAATCLLTDMPLGELTSNFFRIVNEARSHTLGPFSTSFDIQACLLDGLVRYLPEDAHIRVNGKLHISLTRVYDGKNVIVSQFNSRRDLLDALLCACFIPVFSGVLPPKFHGVRYMDGAFSDNLPMLDDNTVTVSPFCGESDICPRDPSPQLYHVNLANTSIEINKQNISRFIRILFPPKPEILSNMCQQGFDDALHFLHRNDLISCTRCLAIQSTFVLSRQTPEQYDPECKSCSFHRDESLVDKTLPETVISAMEKFIIKKSDNSLFRWLQQPALFLLRTFSIPAAVPCDFVYATLSRILSNAPSVKNTIWDLTQLVLDNIHQLINPRQDVDYGYSDKIQSMYDEDPILKQFNSIGHRRSIVDLNPSDVDEPDFEIRGNILSRRNSAAPSSFGSHLNLMAASMQSSHPMGEAEKLDQVAHAAKTDSLYSYHYMDETDHKMKFTKIVDITEQGENESSMTQSQSGNDAGLHIHYDEDDQMLDDEDEQDIIQHDIEVLLPESKELLSDWTCETIKVDEITSDALEENQELTPTGSSSSIESMDFYKPEADQSEQIPSEQHALRRESRNVDA